MSIVIFIGLLALVACLALLTVRVFKEWRQRQPKFDPQSETSLIPATAQAATAYDRFEDRPPADDELLLAVLIMPLVELPFLCLLDDSLRHRPTSTNRHPDFPLSLGFGITALQDRRLRRHPILGTVSEVPDTELKQLKD